MPETVSWWTAEIPEPLPANIEKACVLWWGARLWEGFPEDVRERDRKRMLACAGVALGILPGGRTDGGPA